MILYLILCNEDLSPILEAIGWGPVILTEVLLGGGQWLSPQKDVMNTRARSNGLLLKESKVSNLSQSTFLNDAIHIWNQAPIAIKECTSLYCAKKAIKTFVAALPI